MDSSINLFYFPLFVDFNTTLYGNHKALNLGIVSIVFRRVLENTRFDVSRMAKPERQVILAKLNTPQQFDADKKTSMKDMV